MKSLKWKPDFAEAMGRFDQWWRMSNRERPLLTLNVRRQSDVAPPARTHATWNDYWLDTDYRVDRAVAGMSGRAWLAETFPSITPMTGPEVLATLLGCQQHFISDATGWSEPVVHEPQQWRTVFDAPLRWDNPWWQSVKRMTQRALEVSDGRFLVGLTDLHGNYDILAALRDPQALCEDLLDCPELVREAGLKAAATFNAAFAENWRWLSAAGMPCTTWTGFLHTGPAYLPHCDFWCMMSAAMGRDMVWPAIETEMKSMERSLFHLDGPNALQHLDLLLECRELTGVQWVYGAGNGPATRWLDVYRRCLQAGKTVQVFAENATEALELAQALGSEGVWLQVGGVFHSDGEARQFITDVARASRSATS
ncbi:MAG: hypothetical protein IT440_06615 [Phycisphaeraceae bacterium]|nr:hypothetical protein [Phycisphaeraceae bacterium]